MFSPRPRVFHQIPCFPHPVFSTGPRVFLTPGPRTPGPRDLVPQDPVPRTPYPRTPAPRFPPSCRLTEKQTYFSDQKCNDSQLEKSMSGDGWCRTKHRVTDLHGQQIESLVNFFVMLRDALLVLQVTLSALKKKKKRNSVNCDGTSSFRSQKEKKT